jgi:hypothetical protein
MPPTDDSQDRRSFLRQASRDAVAGAARLAGLTGAVRQTVSAAASAAMDELRQAGEQVPAAAAVVDSVPEAVTVAPAVDASPVPGPAIPEPVPAIPEPVPAPPSLSPDQEAFLAMHRSAALAVNERGSPSQTASSFEWDGHVFRIPTRMFGARASAIARHPNVSLLIGGDDEAGWVSVTGRAEIVPMDGDPSSDAAMIVVTPIRFLWAGPRIRGG